MKCKTLVTILSALVFSAIIEMIQNIFALGLCETDDVIMNSFGAAIGTLSCIAYTKIRKHRYEVDYE